MSSSSICIYISQPITGVSKEHYDKVRARLEALCELEFGKDKCKYMNKYITDAPPASCRNSLLWYIARSLDALCRSDIMVMVKDADLVSKGCRIEKLCAELYGIPIFEKEML